MKYEIEAIGTLYGGRKDPTDDHWGNSHATIELDSVRFGPDALLGLDGFSHAEIIFVFDKVSPEEIETKARRPRNRSDWPMTGIFAQRGKNRPNRLGLTTCKIVSIEGTKLHVNGLDAIDGTPIVDIKPLMREFQPRGETKQPAWVTELMADYW